MLAADHYFCIGDGHTFCEDFADSGEIKTEEGNIPFGIISDGCSGGFAQVDIGARLLTKARRATIGKDLEDEVMSAAWLAQGSAKTLELDQNAMYATLLTLKLEREGFKTEVFGDGVVVARKKDSKDLHVFHYDYQNGPYYLNYHLNGMFEDWVNNRESDHCTLRRLTIKNGEISGTVDVINKKWNECKDLFSFKEYDLVAVLSDGIDSFYKPGETPPYGSPTREQVPFYNMITKLFDFKQYRGDFVRRRCNKFFKECKRDGINHFDDFSMAAVYYDQ